MSDPFDPDAWPNAGTSRKSSPKPKPTPGVDSDGYDPFAFDEQDDNHRQPRGKQPSDSFDYDDFDDLDERQDPRSSKELDDDFEDYLYDDADENDDAFIDEYDDEFDDQEPKSSTSTGKIVAIIAAIGLIGIAGIGITTLAVKAVKDLATDSGSEKKGSNNDPSIGKSEKAPSEVIDSLNKGLESWGKFAVTGDLTLVEPYFVKDGPQFDQFRADAEGILEKPPGGEAALFTMKDPATYLVNKNEWLIRGDVLLTRTGEQTKKYSWEMRLIKPKESDSWQIFSVRPF